MKVTSLALVALVSLPVTAATQESVAKQAAQTGSRVESSTVPITTSSAEGRQIYLEAQKLADEFHFTDAYAKYGEAIAADGDFALAYYGRALSAPTAATFFENLEKAVTRVDHASPAEQHMILALQAGTNSDPAGQLKHLNALVAAYPQDARPHFLLANYYNGRQEYKPAIEHYARAVELDPGFTPAYNVLGYANRALERYDDAERAFKKYIELQPNEPNPYDSYAEFLMKTGRFDGSIAAYRKALAADPAFTFSFIGIGNDQILQGRPEDARATFKEFYDKAVNDGLRRTALFWTAASYVHEWKRDDALATIRRMSAIAEKSGDLAALSGDHVLAGGVLLETGGSPDEALAEFRKAVEVIERADVSEDVKEATRRNNLYGEALVTIRKGDVAAAKSLAEAYRAKVEPLGVAFEVQQVHELNGRIALLESKPDLAVTELEQSNQQDPRNLWALSKAYEAKGDAGRARELAKDTADFNQLSFPYAYVRGEARKAVGES
jgi:tetratricopeptide (TPR) repeat protein